MNNMISKFFNKECKVDLDLLTELKCKGHIAKGFYKYLVLDKGIEEIWISEKDDKFLVEFRDRDCSIYCKKELDYVENKKEVTHREKLNFLMSKERFKMIMEEYNKDGEEMTKALTKEFEEIRKEYRKTIDIYSIIDEKEVLRSTTLNSKRELLKFLTV